MDDNVSVYIKIAELLQSEKFTEAIEMSKESIAANPFDNFLWHNLGVALLEEKRYDEAILAYQNAINLKPDFWQTYWNQSNPLLATGQLKEGFEKFEGRLLVCEPRALVRNRSTSQIWKGEDLRGKTLLLHHDGGFGDTIQFIRYFPLIKEKYQCNIALLLQPELNCLFEHLRAPKLLQQSPPYPFDFHVFMMSLPFCFKTELGNIPPPIKLDCKNKPIRGKVGIAWGAASREDAKNRKSIRLTQIEPLLKIPGIQYVSVQKEVSDEDKILLDRYRVERPPIGSFLDTMKILETCERVISVDTSVAHLAASMGLETWILLHDRTCWRWLLHRTDCPWYPSVKLFRQKELNVWEDPIRRVEQELLKLRNK